MSTALHASISDALYALPAPTSHTWSANTLLRLRTCAALGTALARVRSAPHATDADVARVVYATYFHITTTLMTDAHALSEAEAYWQRVVDDHMRAGLLWLQTLPKRLVSGKQQAVLGISGLCADASAKCARLRRAHTATVRALGTFAMAWHGTQSPRRDVSARVMQLCRAGFDALSYDAAPDASKTCVNATAALLDAVATHESGVTRVLQACGKPGLLTHAWPLLVVYPLVSWAAASAVYHHWTDITTQARAAWEAVQGLLIGWVYMPAMRLVDTLRAGRKQRALLVRGDSLHADEQSLERMVEELGRDTLHMDPAQLAALTERTRAGDLTHVWEVYESAMRRPIRGFLTGSLVRTLLIQVQKAKVDVEVALNGIDWLLRSQELLLGAVGLAPALGLVYLLYRGVSYTVQWIGNQPTSLHASSASSARMDAWTALRHADAMCSSAIENGTDEDEPLRVGHVLLDACALRRSFSVLIRHTCYGNRTARARLLSEALTDLCTMECGFPQKQSAGTTQHSVWVCRTNLIARMWRSWGTLVSVH